jgi:hypothetical protein
MSPKPQTPLTKRAHYPNLLRAPHSPHKGRGRLQVQIRRAFVGREVLTSTEIYDSCYAKRRMLGQQIDRPYRWSVVRILRTIADPIGRAETIGRPVLWRLKTFQRSSVEPPNRLAIMPRLEAGPETKKSPTEAGLKL